jgi:HTH-type transcriptional regulator, competence development regulator
MGTLGEYLRRLRKRSGLTLKDVENAGVASNAYLSLLERGLRAAPHPNILKGLATLYEAPVKDLLIAAGYLPPESGKEPSPATIESAFNLVKNDPRITHGTRKKSPKLSLEAKRYIVGVYETLTGQKLT